LPAPREAASPQDSNAQSPTACGGRAGRDGGGGRVLKEGPGYTIKAASTVAPRGRAGGAIAPSPSARSRAAPRADRVPGRTAAAHRQPQPRVRRRRGERARRLRDHITNSHISATGVGVTPRAANVHIDNSLIEGDTASIDASDGAQVYGRILALSVAMSRRLDNAAFHDLGANIWN